MVTGVHPTLSCYSAIPRCNSIPSADLGILLVWELKLVESILWFRAALWACALKGLLNCLPLCSKHPKRGKCIFNLDRFNNVFCKLQGAHS